MTTKKWYDSKMVIFNLLSTIVGVAMIIKDVSLFEKYSPVILAVVGIVNLILRIWFTDKPIEASLS